MSDTPKASTIPTKIAALLNRIRDAHRSSSLRRLNNALCVFDTELDALTARISAARGDEAATTAAKDTATAEQMAAPLSTEPPALEAALAVATAEPITSRAEATTTPSDEPAPAPVVSIGVAIGGGKKNDATQKAAAPVPWEESTRKLLEKAKEAAERRDFERGWRCLKAADRFMLYGLAQVDPTALEIRAKAIANEAADDGKGLSKWRQKSIQGLLEDKCGDLVVPVKADLLVEAKRILDEHQDNVYQRLSILKSRLQWLFWIGMVFLAVWLILSPPVPRILSADDALASIADNSLVFWVVIMLAGVLGSLISSFTSAIGVDIKRSNIPADLATHIITQARLVVGALSALAVTLVLSAGILSFQELSYAFVVAIAVVSGFTDRFLISAIERVASPK
jgi:hypothetical protein